MRGDSRGTAEQMADGATNAAATGRSKSTSVRLQLVRRMEPVPRQSPATAMRMKTSHPLAG